MILGAGIGRGTVWLRASRTKLLDAWLALPREVDLQPEIWTVQNGNFLVISRLGDERIAMKVSKFSEQQIALILKQVDDGLGVDDVCRKAGVSQQTYYRWRKKYGGLMPSEVRRLKQLEEENRRLKQMVADLSLDKAMLQDVLSKKP
jgi:putative transposase